MEEDSGKRKNATRACKLVRNSKSCSRQDHLEVACSRPYSTGGEKELSQVSQDEYILDIGYIQ